MLQFGAAFGFGSEFSKGRVEMGQDFGYSPTPCCALVDEGGEISALCALQGVDFGAQGRLMGPKLFATDEKRGAAVGHKGP